MNNFKNSSSGVTLIALVITIIVLIILAGVSIWSLTREKNIINQAFEAKNQSSAKDIEEEVNQQWLLVLNDTKLEYPTNEELAQKLQDRLSGSSVSYNSGSNVFDVSYKGKTVKVTTAGGATVDN